MSHEFTGTRLYSVWASMHRRCNNKQDANYKYYGGKGICVCRRWDDIYNFLADMGHPPEGMSIGRIDSNDNYSPDNCRWETQEQQNENTSRNKFISYNGQTKILKEWAKEYNIAPRRLSERLRRGWPIEKSLNTPCPQGYEQGRKKCLEYNKELWKEKGKQYRENSKLNSERMY